MLTRTTRQGSNSPKKIDEIQLLNKKKNDKLRKQQQEEEKRKKDEAEKEERVRSAEEGANQDQEWVKPQNLLGIMNGDDPTDQSTMEVDNIVDNEDEHSPLKKRTGSSKTTPKRNQALVTPPPPRAKLRPPSHDL
jgi:hypothetical protein